MSSPQHPPRTVVLLQYTGIGDLVWHIPYFKRLAQLSANGQITVVAQPSTLAKHFIGHEPWVEAVIDHDHRPRRGEKRRGRHAGLRGMWRMAQELKAGRYDRLVLFSGRASRGLIAGLSGIPVRLGFGYRWLQRVFLTQGPYIQPYQGPSLAVFPESEAFMLAHAEFFENNYHGFVVMLTAFGVARRGFFKGDLFIASAAVADYRPEVVAAQKLKKDPTTGDGMLLQMVRNPDILATIAGRSDRPFSVGFAAETEHLLDYATRKLKDKNLDLIVANDVANPSIGFNSEENALTVIDRQQHQTLFAQTSKGKIARQLVAFIAERLNQVQ